MVMDANKAWLVVVVVVVTLYHAESPRFMVEVECGKFCHHYIRKVFNRSKQYGILKL